VEAPALGGIRERSAFGNARALVATQAKRLLLMTARAARCVLARRFRVHREVIVRVYAPWTYAPIVTIGAVLFAVAIAAKATVVTGDGAMANDPIRAMVRIFEPARREQLLRAEARAQPRAVAQMTRRAFAVRSPLPARIVTADARLHAR
jgi:hypothetical protein